MRHGIDIHNPKLLFNRWAGILKIPFCIAAFSLGFGAAPIHAQIYVDADAAGGGDGTSWATAYNTLQDALAEAEDGDQIWVAEGIYFPDEGGSETNDDRFATFQLISGVEIYGGFKPGGGDDTFNERDWTANPTILSGDIDKNDTTTDGVVTSTNNISGDNSYHVVTGSGADATAILNGFTITAGRGNRTSETDGAGMFNNAGSPTLTNLIFSGNSTADDGGGMYNENGSNPALSNVTFSGNNANSAGGGIYNEVSHPTLTNVTFSANRADYGGGMLNQFSSPTLTNVIFAVNSATTTGGGMYNQNSSTVITNGTFFGNTGSGMFNAFSNPTLTNVIMWGNLDSGSSTSVEASINNGSNSSTPTISNSLIANSGGSGGWNSAIGNDGGNNIDDDPLFVNTSDPNGADNIWGTADDGLYLLSPSPAIDAGDDSALPADTQDLDGDSITSEDLPYDITGEMRILDNAVDIGAYESPSITVNSDKILYVDKNVSGGNQSGDSWSNAIEELRNALMWAQDWDGDADGTLQIWVAEGLYMPAGNYLDRTATFQLVDDVWIYGGFDPDGGNDEFDERDWTANPTVLSGDIDTNDTTTGGVVTDTDDVSGKNSYHVVTGSGTDGSAILNGFTITGGRAAGTDLDDSGGGMLNSGGSPTLTNLIFIGNYASFGSGIYNFEDSNPILTNIFFNANHAIQFGGGMGNTFSHPTLNNVVFTGNHAMDRGGAIYNGDSSPALTNVTISGNQAGNNGGGISNVYLNVESPSNPALANVIIWDNQAGGDSTIPTASIFNVGSTPSISNSLIANSGGSGSWSSNFGTDDGNNLDTDPLFVDLSDPDGTDNIFGTADDGLQLAGPSQAIDTGDDSALPADINDLDGDNNTSEDLPYDITGEMRILIDAVDMGAYESPGISPYGDNILYVDQNLSGGNQTGDSWANAIHELRDALGWAQDWDGDADGTLQIWVADGLYLPTSDDSDRSASFNLINDVEIYGGFSGNGTEDELSDRDIDSNLAILSGDIDENDDPFEPDVDSDSDSGTPTQIDHLVGDNSLHVVRGGGTDATAILDGFTITAGKADGGDGGGIYIATGTPILRNLMISGNRAGSNGGGMYNAFDSPTLTNIIFDSNVAFGDGGGMYNERSHAKLTDVTFSDNRALQYNGGGMYNFLQSNPVLINVKFSNNRADRHGGGLYNLNNSNPTLTNVIFIGNRTGDFGGGMFSGASSEATLTNVVFSNNHSDRFGGGMYNDTGTATLTNVTFFGNNADTDGGGFVSAISSTALLRNVIMWDNQANGNSTTTSASIYIFEDDYPVITNSLIANSGGSGNWNSDFGTDGGNNIDTDPNFVNPADPDGADDLFGTDDDGLALLLISPAINSGDNTRFESGGVAESVDTDLADNDRIFNSTVDMGAYEFQDDPASPLTPDGNVIYVDQNVSGGNQSGGSWANAYPGLTYPLGWVAANWDGDSDGPLQIWVAEGTYMPYQLFDTDQDRYYAVPADVMLLGGFEGDETTVDERNWAEHPTILSGDLDNGGSAGAGDSHTILNILGNDVVVDGFIFEHAYADGSSQQTRGGAVVNTGDGVQLSNSILRNNQAVGDGGSGIGGGMLNYGNITLVNNLFTDNASTDRGGAIFNLSGDAEVINNTIAGNSGSDIGGIFLLGGTLGITNSIFDDNGENLSDESGITISHSLLDAALPSNVTDGGDNQESADPMFSDAGNGDYTLTNSSPALNVGDNTPFESGGAAENITKDLAGNDRIFESTVDLGAYESQEELLTSNILYVDQNVSGGSQDGSSWANAFPELRDAFDWAANDWDGSDPPLQIWVADGLYLPTADDSDRDASFQLINNVEIYGGFTGDGIEDELSDRDWTANPTILSGDIDGDDTTTGGVVTDTDNINGNNSFKVATSLSTDASAILDGVIITGGLANGVGEKGFGGGMLNFDSDATLSNITFSGNSAVAGGGMTNDENSSPTLTNIIFSGNSAHTGGGMNNFESNPTLTNVTFSGNSATGNGGGMYNGSSSPALINVTFSDNSASDDGGGMDNASSSPTLVNVTFSGNTASGKGGGMHNEESSNPMLTNVIIWDNEANESTTSASASISNEFSSTPEISHSLIANSGGSDSWNTDLGTDGGNNIDDDAAFTDPENGDFTLTNTSPAINTGDTSTDLSLFPGGPSDPTDLAGNPRVYDGETDVIDMGAYEFQGEPGTPEPLVSPQLSSPSDEATDVNLPVTLMWNSVSGADSYQVQLVEVSGSFGTPDVDDETTDTQAEVTGLSASTEYMWRVRSLTSDDQSEWSQVWTFTTADESSPPTGSDQRILVGNNQDYEFSGDDFGVSDAGWSIIIESLPDQGDLEYEGSAVSAGDEVTVVAINSGMLTWSPPQDEYGYNFTGFDFTIVDEGDLESGQAYTLTIDLAATSVQLTGGEGWRFVASPAGGETVGGFLEPIWTQGFTGSDSPGASFTNVQFLDQGTYTWDPADNATNPMTVGQAAIVYVYSDDDNTGADEGFPKTLASSTTDWEPLDGSFGGSLLYDDLQDGEDDNDESFFLLGNPHPIAIDFCQTTRSNVADNIDVWDPNLNDGDYRNLSCSGSGAEIAPFQGYWVRVQSDGNNYQIPMGAYMEGTAGGYFKEPEPNREQLLITMNVTGGEHSFTNTAHILLSEQGTMERDLSDAAKRSPAGLARRYLSFYSLDNQNRPYALQDLPRNVFATEDKLRIPLDIATTESGEFTLDWTLPESHLFHGSYYLKDTQTTEVIELREGATYTFEITEDQAQKVLTADEAKTVNPKLATVNPHPGSARFELLIASAGVDGLAELGGVPEQFTLSQNYPNPFNPSTVIAYQLPVSSVVRLEVYDMLGRNVATLVNEQVAAGRHAVSFDANNLSSGIYLYRLQAGSTIMTKKLTVVK